VVRAAWGLPTAIKKRSTKSERMAEWTYPFQTVFFKNEVVTAVTQNRQSRSR
jgi:hypothetical protein